MRYLDLRIPIPEPEGLLHLQPWLPSRGNVLFTLVVVAGLLWASNAGALPLRIPAAVNTSTGTIAYQGRLADSAGNPLTGTYGMIFRLYDAATDGTPLWEEQWTGSNGVRVSDGLFNVMLGSLTPIQQSVITGHDTLWLGITVGTDNEMTPRVQLGSVPFAVQALSVPDDSVTTEKLADGAVTTAKLNLVDGHVGIGTTNPTAALHVASRTNEFPSYYMQKITYDDIGVGNSGQTLYGLKIDTNFAGSGNPTNIGLDVDVSGSRTATRYAALLNGGNVGIGTKEPSDRLHVVDSGLDWAARFNNTGADVRLAFKDGNGIFVRSDASANPYLLELNSSASTAMKVMKDGTTNLYGTLNMHGNPIINQGSMVEAGLQTPDELAAKRIPRFSEGDVLCWVGKRLEKCDQANDRRVVAVADVNGKPIVIGAEPIKVLGPVKVGDLLVASDVAGYVMANNQPAPGTVVAKALEDFAGQRGYIKAMIRTP